MTVTLPDQLSDAARSFAARDHGLLIDGASRAAADGRTFETCDPATARPIATVPQGGAADVDAAVQAAGGAFDDGDVDDVVVSGLPGEHTDTPGTGLRSSARPRTTPGAETAGAVPR